MARGGARPNAGRKKGSRNKNNRAIAVKALAEGISPLEVILEAMRKNYEAQEYDKAAIFAEKAAPYMHPRLQAVQHTGKDGGPIEHHIAGAKDALDGKMAGLAARTGAQGVRGKPDGR